MIRLRLVVLEASLILLGLVDAFHVNNLVLQRTEKPLFPFHRDISRDIPRHISGRRGTSLAFFWQKNQEAAEDEDTVEKPVEKPNDGGPGPDVKAMEAKAVKQELDPKEQAEQLKSQAQRARLEAARMDAELTIQKLNRLEKEMKSAAAKGDAARLESLQAQMDQLQAKVSGEPPKPKVVLSTSNSSNGVEAPNAAVAAESLREKLGLDVPFSQERFDDIKEIITAAPSMAQKLMAMGVEVDFDANGEINVTEVALRLEKTERLDFSYSSLPPPTFTDEEIQRAKEEAIKSVLFNVGMGTTTLRQEVRDAAAADDEIMALMYLEYDYFASVEINEDNVFDKLEQLAEGEDWLKGIIDAVNTTAVDSTVSSLYPKCTRKEDAVLPTMAQMTMLTSDILPRASFKPQGKPEQVLSGYIVRGYSNLENGDDVIASIDAQLEKTILKDKMTVLYTKDFTLLAAEMELDDVDFFTQAKDPDNEPPILFVMGKDILAERNRIALTLTTMIGVSTSWYLALYPFLLNPTLAKRVEEQLALADSNMAYDLGWLTDLSVPLFVSFLGIQLLHELAHRVAASFYDAKLNFPVFVPSLITGITSPVTTFKEPPKSKEAMFDIALAGPLTGVLAALAALVLGTQLTVVSDPTLFPALPVEILRQSTLGGSIIGSILGDGALSIPEGALGSAAVSSITVSLHPLAIAGYIGLIVNSLALLPIGTTDGGRAALCMYGRGTRLLVGNAFLFAVFLAGTLGSDLFLFYFAFAIAFQSGNEIPARNEVDNISFPRVVVGIAATVVALLALIPFQ